MPFKLIKPLLKIYIKNISNQLQKSVASKNMSDLKGKSY